MCNQAWDHLATKITSFKDHQIWWGLTKIPITQTLSKEHKASQSLIMAVNKLIKTLARQAWIKDSLEPKWVFLNSRDTTTKDSNHRIKDSSWSIMANLNSNLHPQVWIRCMRRTILKWCLNNKIQTSKFKDSLHWIKPHQCNLFQLKATNSNQDLLRLGNQTWEYRRSKSRSTNSQLLDPELNFHKLLDRRYHLLPRIQLQKLNRSVKWEIPIQVYQSLMVSRKWKSTLQLLLEEHSKSPWMKWILILQRRIGFSQSLRRPLR